MRVDFSADLANLSLDAKLTNDSGEASIEIMNTEAVLGAGTLSVSTVSLSASIDYEFIGDASIEQFSTLSVRMTKR